MAALSQQPSSTRHSALSWFTVLRTHFWLPQLPEAIEFQRSWWHVVRHRHIGERRQRSVAGNWAESPVHGCRPVPAGSQKIEGCCLLHQYRDVAEAPVGGAGRWRRAVPARSLNRRRFVQRHGHPASQDEAGSSRPGWFIRRCCADGSESAIRRQRANPSAGRR